MQEIWIEISHNSNHPNDIIAISNTGLYKLRKGTINVAKLRHHILINGEYVYTYKILAEHFIPKTPEDIALGRNCIDHITHNPEGMNINDIRNLRWCTRTENNNFAEARCNSSNARKGKLLSEETKRKISISLKGKNTWTKGKPNANRGKHWKLVNGKRVWY